jgi:uncharacterized protein YndB with AHSA1/START domain
MTSKKKTRSVSHQYFINESPKKVFRALTDSKLLVRWLSDNAEITPSKGGRYKIGWKNGPQHSGTVLDFVPGRSVTLSWEWEGVDLYGTKFKLSVEAKEKGSLLKVEHSGFPVEERWVDLYAGAEWGWTYFAMNLKSVIENGFDLRSKYDG